MYKKLFLILGLIFYVSFAYVSFAAQITTTLSNQVIHKQQEFYTDIMLDTTGQNINTIGLQISVPQNITFERYDDSNSLVTVWVNRPTLINPNTIYLSGIIPNGFTSVVDPFSPKYILPGKIIRLYFVAKNSGSFPLTISNIDTYLNDGQGTKVDSNALSPIITVDNISATNSVQTLADHIPPLSFTPAIVSDPNLYNGKYVVIFNTQDKESGIDYYQVKEGNKDWVTATSPYLLIDQSLNGDIVVKAVDKAGNVTLETAQRTSNISTKNNKTMNLIEGLIVAVIILCVIIFIVRWLNKRQYIKD